MNAPGCHKRFLVSGKYKHQPLKSAKDSLLTKIKVKEARRIHTRVCVHPPRAADALVLFVNLQVDVSEPLGDSDSEIDPGVTCADHADFHPTVAV